MNSRIRGIDMGDTGRSITLLNEHIQACQAVSGDYREAFFFTNNYGHVICMIYIKEGDRQCLINADSVGVNERFAAEFQSKLNYGIEYRTISIPRQTDEHSCYIDFLVFSRDITAKDANTNTYRLKEIFSYIDDNCTTESSYDVRKLPAQLLKASQNIEFIKKYGEDGASDAGSVLEITAHNYNPAYLWNKAKKYRKIAEIQFYINEIERLLEHPLCVNDRKDFIFRAKTIKKDRPKEPDLLYKFSLSFIQEITDRIAANKSDEAMLASQLQVV